MFPSKCEVKHADSLADATALLREHGAGAHVLAGGQSLIPLMKQRLATPDVLINVSHLDTGGVQIGTERVRIHALTTHAAVEDHEWLSSNVDVVADAMPQLADRQVRNMGTVGGGLAEADPGNDWGPILLTTGGTIHTVSPDGEREVPASELFEAPFTTVLDDEELIQSVSFPVPEANTGGAYLKKKRRQGVYGVASVGVQLTIENGTCRSAGVAIADDVQSYVHPTEVVELLTGRQVTDALVAEASDRVAAAVDPMSDNRGSAAYKRNLCTKLFERAVDRAYERAAGEV